MDEFTESTIIGQGLEQLDEYFKRKQIPTTYKL